MSYRYARTIALSRFRVSPASSPFITSQLYPHELEHTSIYAHASHPQLVLYLVKL